MNRQNICNFAVFYYIRMSRGLEVPRHRASLTFIYFSVSAALCMVQY